LIVAPDYQTEQFLLYPLLGEGRAAARDVAVVDDEVPVRDVAGFVREGDPLPVEARPSFRGRPAYAVSLRTLRELRPLGVRGERVGNRLWHLVPEPAAGAR
jgi:hypothetical protein